MTNKEPLKIKEVHNWMQAMLINHQPVAHAGASPADVVNASQRLSAEQHLGIYRQSYIARLRDCMKNQFKGLAYALGETLFQAFVDQYLDSNPSTSYTLNHLGEKFPFFLEQTRPDVEDEVKEDWPDFIIELATFEYALSLVFDMAGAEDMLPPDSDTAEHLLIASPTLQLFKHHFPICQYYLDFNANLSPELPFPQQSYAAVSRQNYRLGLFNIGPDQYYFLNCIKSGNSIAEAKNKLITFLNIEKVKLEQVWPIWRKNFIASGFFTRIQAQ